MHYGFVMGFLLLLCAQSGSVYAGELSRDMSVLLQPAEGDPVQVASIDFEKSGEGAYTYTLKMDASRFGDHFLSMRPFKCLDAPRHMLCRLPYPYTKTATIRADHLLDLEYDLLFIHRQSSDYGIDPWNGIYYKLSLADDGASIQGVLHEVDLDILAAPPEEGVKYPIQAVDLNEAKPAAHSYPRLVIREKN